MTPSFDRGYLTIDDNDRIHAKKTYLNKYEIIESVPIITELLITKIKLTERFRVLIKVIFRGAHYSKTSRKCFRNSLKNNLPLLM